MLPSDRRAVGAALAVVLATAAVYLPTLANGFIGFDDDVYITANPLIASLSTANLWTILTRPYAEFYHPVTMLSLAFDRWLWEFNPFGYHLTDWILHVLNTALVFWICYRLVMIGGRTNPGLEARRTSDLARTAATIAAALFGLHPLHVESVAWAAQRKDLLCAFFYLLAFGFYLSHASRNHEQDAHAASQVWYRLSLAAFLLALLSKSMAMTLPLALILVDIYPLRRLQIRFTGRTSVPPRSPDERRVWIEKLPFFGLAAAIVIATLAAQAQGGAIRSSAEIPWSLRPWLVIHSYVFYLWKAISPKDLTVLYPIPLQAGVHDAASWIGVAALAVITAGAWLARRRWPVVAAAWAYYVVTLAPVCGLLTFGAQSVADRYSYLPLLGPFLLAGLIIGRVNLIGDQGWRPSLRVSAAIAAAFAIIACACLTSRQIVLWRDGESLWNSHLGIYPRDARARFNLAYSYHSHGQLGQAKIEYERSLQLEPRYFDAQINLGSILLQQNDAEGAADHFRKALEEKPDHAGAHLNMGLALARLQRPDEAIEHFKQAVTFDPRNADAHASLGQALAEQGNAGAAIREYRSALSLNPQMAAVHENLGFAYLAVNQFETSRREFERAVSLQPRSPDALIELSRFDAAGSQPLRALGRLSRAARYQPRNPEIPLLMADIVRGQGALGLAESLLRQARQLDPENVEAYFQLGLFLEEQERYGEALDALTEAWVLLQYEEEPVPEALAEALRRVDAEVNALESEQQAEP